MISHFDFIETSKKYYPKPIKFFTPIRRIALFGYNSNIPILKEKSKKRDISVNCLIVFMAIILFYYIFIIVFS